MRSTECGFLVSRYMNPPPPAPASDMPSTCGSSAFIMLVTSSGSQPGAIFFFSCQYSDMHWPTPVRSPGHHENKNCSFQYQYYSDSFPSGCNCIPVSARHGSMTCVCPSLRQQVVVVGFGPPQPATWSYHAADCQPMASVLLVPLVQSAGTLYWTIWSHQTFV